MKTKANWARMIAAIFTVAIFYASVCSTACMVGICPNQVQQTAGHDCDQIPSHHSDHSKHHSRDNPDCSQHQHPNLLAAKTGDLSKFTTSAATRLNISVTDSSSIHGAVASFTNAKASDHVLPLALRIPIFQQISVLRI